MSQRRPEAPLFWRLLSCLPHRGMNHVVPARARRNITAQPPDRPSIAAGEVLVRALSLDGRRRNLAASIGTANVDQRTDLDERRNRDGGEGRREAIDRSSSDRLASAPVKSAGAVLVLRGADAGLASQLYCGSKRFAK